MIKIPALPVLLFAAVLLLAGCARSVPVIYYQLTAVGSERQAAVAPQRAEALIGIGPISLPEYLDRPQIVSRLSANRLQLADHHRWAGPLGDNIARVVQKNLARALGSEGVVLYPWGLSLPVDQQISIEILRCEADEGGKVQFEALWTMIDREGKVLLPQRRSSQRIRVAPPADYDRKVAALSEALAGFAEEIATEIR